MPRKPAHPCNYPGCPKLTTERFCPEHQQEYAKNYEKYHRNREAKSKYDSKWNHLRKRYIAKHPWCEECLKEGRYQEYAKNYEKYHRNREAKSKYDSKWNHLRKRYIAKHPWCEECLKEGRYVKVEHVHHRIPLSEGGTNDWNNLESVCRSCHSKIHARRGDRFGR